MRNRKSLGAYKTMRALVRHYSKDNAWNYAKKAKIAKELNMTVTAVAKWYLDYKKFPRPPKQLQKK